MHHPSQPTRRPRLAGRVLLLGAALLVAAGPLCAYTIYLKDGSSLQAREKYKVQGGTAMITLPSGAQSTLPLAQIDVPKTERSNASDFGSATVITAPAATPTPGEKKGPSLAELAAQRRVTPMPTRPPAATPPPVATRAPVAEPPKGSLARTPAGFVDFFRTARSPVAEMDVQTAAVELLRTHGVSNAGVYGGSEPRRLLVEVTVNSEGGVFQAIAATAQTLLGLQEKQVGSVEAIELFLTTDSRQRAGQFVITPERAQELVAKKLDVAQFFIKYVEF